MSQQVITIDPYGAISGLQRKRGQGVDLRAFGPVDIHRASEIVWYPRPQQWCVHLLVPDAALHVARNDDGDVVLTREAYERVTGLEGPDVEFATDDETGRLEFEDYDDAVKVEVEVLDALRLQGKVR